jgi:hypothetical protein
VWLSERSRKISLDKPIMAYAIVGLLVAGDRFQKPSLPS